MKLIDSVKGALKVVNAILQNVSPVKPLRLSPTKNNVFKEKALALNDTLGDSFLKTVRVHLLTFLRHIQNANTEATILTSPGADEDFNMENTPGSRYKLKEVFFVKY